MLTAATELLVECGLRGVTVDAVAERSGVAKSTLYRHWPSMNELMIDVVRANVPEQEPVDLSGGFEPALRSWMHASIVALSAPDWARTLPALLELRTHSIEMAEVLAADMQTTLAVVASILDLGVAEGRVPAGLDPHHVTRTLVGPLVLASLAGDEDLAELADYALDRFFASYATAAVTPVSSPVSGQGSEPAV